MQAGRKVAVGHAFERNSAALCSSCTAKFIKDYVFRLFFTICEIICRISKRVAALLSLVPVRCHSTSGVCGVAIIAER